MPTLWAAAGAAGAEFWLGADQLARDIWSRIVWAPRLTLMIVAAGGRHRRRRSASPSAPLAGYLGGWVDAVLMRITDILPGVPSPDPGAGVVAALGPASRTR